MNKGNIILLENEQIISNNYDVGNIFNEYFVNITTTLNVPKWTPELASPTNFFNPVRNAILKYKDHPSILKIKSKYSNGDVFSFQDITIVTVETYIKNLDSKKSTSGPIPAKLLKISGNICSEYICNYINTSINSNTFPDDLKKAEITPCYKKGHETAKENYRPISILPVVSKLFERTLYDQIESFFKDKFSMYLCGFRKGYSTQYALTHLLYKWQKCLDDKGFIGTILTDLSKAYDCLPHDLLLLQNLKHMDLTKNV